MSDTEIREMEEYLSKATPGPWYQWDYENLHMAGPIAVATIPEPEIQELEPGRISSSVND